MTYAIEITEIEIFLSANGVLIFFTMSSCQWLRDTYHHHDIPKCYFGIELGTQFKYLGSEFLVHRQAAVLEFLLSLGMTLRLRGILCRVKKAYQLAASRLPASAGSIRGGVIKV